MKRCAGCGHHDAEHIAPIAPAAFSSERWTVAKCFHWDGETYCVCEELEEE